MRFLYAVLSALIVGILVGHFFHYDFGNAYEIILLLLIFFVGMDLGTGNLRELRGATKKHFFSLWLPLRALY